MANTGKRGIVLMNLGSTDSTKIKDVRRYLNEFLMDERVIDSPYLLRLLLVKGIITPFRAPKSAKAYKSVWTPQGSPLVVITRQQQAALQQLVKDPVEIAMRYGNPGMKLAFDILNHKVQELEQVIAIPLYPHYAMSSYETAVEHAKEVHRKNKYPFSLSFTETFYNRDDYIHALSESMRPYLEKEYDQVLFSYHGLPERHMRKADPTKSHCLQMADCCNEPSIAHVTCYRHQCFVTTKLVAENLCIQQEKVGLSFQSRLGREEWLKPYTVVRFKQMPNEGIKKLLVVCPAFVSDCLETLEEMAKEGKEIFLNAGGQSFTLIPCLN
ncbi:MAG: ferrochelatase, partial [Bacteroidota bacterium]|nr:ferrochelatase [Bacteroidota bacterium]